MKSPTVSGTWLVVLMGVLAAAALVVSVLVANQAVQSEQRQRAALAALRDFSALLSKMDTLAVGEGPSPNDIATWMAAFQTRPGLPTGSQTSCNSREGDQGMRWISAPGGATAGVAALAEARRHPLDELGPNVYSLHLPRGAICPGESTEVVAVIDTAGPLNVIVARTIPATGRAWGLAVLAIAAMGVVVLTFGVAAATWTRTRLVNDVRRINQSLEQAGRGDFGPPLPTEEVSGDLRDLARQVNVTLGRIQELLTWLRDTSDQLAHDFRTPLARARARLDQFGEDGDATLVTQAREDLRFLTRAMNESLALRDGEAWAFETVRLDQICKAAAELYEPLAEADQVTIETDLRLSETLGVASLMQRAVANLVDNAVKFSPPGGVVRLRTYTLGDWAVVSVADNGPGMAATEADNDEESHGMGLAFVRAIVRRHGGTLEIDTSPQGSTVTIRV